MQVWKCQKCGKEFHIEKNDPNSPGFKFMMEHIEEYLKEHNGKCGFSIKNNRGTKRKGQKEVITGN